MKKQPHNPELRRVLLEIVDNNFGTVRRLRRAPRWSA
jgi:hypothetical protein